MAELKLKGELSICKETFNKYWDILTPEVTVRTPKKDCCNSCTKFRQLISKGGTKESLKEIRDDWSVHVKESLTRRSFFKIDRTVLTLDPKFLCFSFDFKQNISLPLTTWL